MTVWIWHYSGFWWFEQVSEWFNKQNTHYVTIKYLTQVFEKKNLSSFLNEESLNINMKGKQSAGKGP